MIYFVQFVTLFLGFTSISKTYLDFKKGKDSLFMLIFWTSAWTTIIFVSIFPDLVEKIIAAAGYKHVGIGTFLGLAFVFLFFIIYRIYSNLHRIERQIRDIVSEVGIKNIEE